MHLSKFILSNLEEILSEWESFASTVLPENKFETLVLRDEAEEILKTIAIDMETAQSTSEQADKSKGRAAPRTEQDSAAELHAADRLRLGFNQVQVVSEYRALRATVIRLWVESSPEIDDSAMDQLIRFNEGIDQALSESTSRFMQLIENSRDFATAVMAHDLRNPLNAIVSSAQFLVRAERPDRDAIKALASTILDSGNHMVKLIENLVDFTRTRLGQPLPIKPNLIDLEQICRQTVAEIRAAHPQRTIRLNCQGELHGTGDATRMTQMLSNLLSNAIEHGSQNTPITVKAYVDSDDVVLQIHNEGPPIPPSNLAAIFNPLARFGKQDKMVNANHLGLGLFIAREIVKAHSGQINATSTAQEGTTFVVRLPRRVDDQQ